MAKKKTKDKKEEGEVVSKPFNYTAYIEKTITTPKAFLYYIKSNKITLNNEKDVEKLYEQFKQGGKR